MSDLKLSYAGFKSLMGALSVYYTSAADGTYKIYCFPPGGDCNYAVVAGSDVADFNANIKPTATSVASRDVAQATNNAATGGGAVSNRTLSSVSQNTSAVTLKAANPNRKGLTIWNDAAQAGQLLYIKLGTGASASSYTVAIDQGVGWEMPLPTDPTIVTGVWSAGAGGAARITETS